MNNLNSVLLSLQLEHEKRDHIFDQLIVVVQKYRRETGTPEQIGKSRVHFSPPDLMIILCGARLSTHVTFLGKMAERRVAHLTVSNGRHSVEVLLVSHDVFFFFGVEQVEMWLLFDVEVDEEGGGP